MTCETHLSTAQHAEEALDGLSRPIEFAKRSSHIAQSQKERAQAPDSIEWADFLIPAQRVW